MVNWCSRVIVKIKGASLHLIKFVVQEQIVAVLREPSLVSVLGSLIGCSRNQLDVVLIGDINNGEGVLVVVEADLVTMESRVGAVILVSDALAIMGVTIISITTSINWHFSGYVNDVKTSVASVGSNDVGISGIGVDSNVVGSSKIRIVVIGSNLENFVFANNVLPATLFVSGQQNDKVNNLQSMVVVFRYNVCSVIVNLYVSPNFVRGASKRCGAVISWKVSQNHRVLSVSDVNKTCSIRMSNNGNIIIVITDTDGGPPDIACF